MHLTISQIRHILVVMRGSGHIADHDARSCRFEPGTVQKILLCSFFTAFVPIAPPLP